MPRNNIYMGQQSTAKLPVHGRIDEDWEFLMSNFSLAYDAVNAIMLTKTPGRFDPTTEKEIKARFAMEKSIARRRDPSKLKLIEHVEQLSLANLYGRLSDKAYLRKIREIHRKAGLSEDLINLAEHKIDMAERSPAHPRIKTGVPPPKNIGNVQRLFRPQSPTKEVKHIQKLMRSDPDPSLLFIRKDIQRLQRMPRKPIKQKQKQRGGILDPMFSPNTRRRK